MTHNRSPTKNVKRVTIIRREGRADLCDKPNRFRSLGDANLFLSRQRPPQQGYDKHDFIIQYKGRGRHPYKGRYDVGSDYPTLEEHIFQFQRYHKKQQQKGSLF